MAALVGCLVILAPLVARAAPYAAYVIDARTGQVLYSKNANTPLHPASLTKMLTLYITFDAIRRGEISLDSYVTVTRHAANQPPSKLGLQPGQKIKLRYLIRAAAVKSANDAAAAIGDAIGGSEAGFAKRMNDTAKMLGMTRSTFKNANGLTRTGHLSTAHDMAILGRHLFYDFPQYYNIFSRRSTDAGVRRVYSTNRKFLNAYKGADGIKTGYTYASGFNLVASAKRGQKRIIGVIFGGTSTAQRNAKMAHLLDIGFSRAPAYAKVQKPVAPDLDMVAQKDAPGAPVRVAVGKTIRLATAVHTSPRPRLRPDGATPTQPPSSKLLVAMKDDISSALNAVEDSQPAADPVKVAEDAPAADPAVPAEDPGDGLARSPVPAPRPGSAAPVQVAAAEPAAQAETRTAAADTAGADTVAPATSPAPTPAPAQATVVAMADTAPASDEDSIDAIEPTAASGDGGPQDDSAASSGIVFASAAPATTPTPEARPEIVTRMSTSGGRDWGINVGRFPSRYQAEKALLRTALTESSALSDSLRKVVRRKNGFDANFMGMTQDQADLACARLQARDIQCFSLSPS
ncbi:D-alanyl-D-alanine carboxypeptidase family protein [Acidimangrovimonas pyrenivorans]|uniref:D-alanyl-D-alanine carboxypeptidase family protein n=1 Tax=Acidimangrovimonas pyrenivorans TaxID=2030798 RepID=A0ABV7AGF4_9RHOB